MNEKIEIQGKTVEDAVNEALLRLGARRDEVDVTVLDEPKSGFLGILGGRPARVEVSRKRSQRRGQRQGAAAQAHEFGDGSESNRRGGSRGRRGRGDRRDRNDRNDRSQNDSNRDQEASGKRDGRNQRGEREDEGSRDKREASGRGQGGRGRNDRNNRNEDRPEGEGGNRSRSRRRRSRRKPRSDSAEAQNQNNRQDEQPRERKERPAAARVADDQPTERSQDPRRSRSRNQRGRRRSEGGRVDRDPRPAETMENVEANGNTVDASENQNQERQENRGRGGRRGDSRRRDERRSEPRNESRKEARAEKRDEDRGRSDEKPRVDTIDEIIASGISALKYAEAMRGVSEEDINATIEKLTGDVLVRAGFPVRCEVKDGEYRQVRITTGDDGAAVLIGRHGATIDSLEHLIERMISTAHGDRVRMNLDVNNYRRRRSDNLLDRVEEAVEQVRSSGKAYHVEPMNARERRLVHLAVEEYDGMRTFTMDSHRGRHVVIALDDKDEGGTEDRESREVAGETTEAPTEVTQEATTVETEAPAAEDAAVVAEAPDAVAEVEVEEREVAEETLTDPEEEDRK